MRTVQEIRLANFDSLLAEAGTAAKLATLCGISPPYISQLRKRPDRERTRKKIDDAAARKFEAGMQKNVGWMDTEHSTSVMFSELDSFEAQLVTLFRKLGAEDRDDVLMHVNNLFSRRFPSASQGNPYPKPPPASSSPHVARKGSRSEQSQD